MARGAACFEYERQIWDRLDDIACPGEHDRLSGQNDAMDVLHHAFSSGRMHHAWLITGPKGIGKATLALKFTAEILAPEPSQPEQKQEVKRLLALGGHPNVHHVMRSLNKNTDKFSSEITIDDIRKAKKFFLRTRAQDNWRICIIDTADDLNNNSTNALLKILEEPPQRSLFFILSNFPGRLLPTIRSRCRRLNLKPLSQPDLFDVLEGSDVATGDMTEEQKKNLFKLSNGSVRRAIVLLQLDGLALFSKFQQLIRAPQDWVEIHKLADDLSRANRQEHYDLLLDIAREHVSGFIHQNAAATDFSSQGVDGNNGRSRQNAASTLTALARMCEVWEKTANSASLANAYNLDKKQVLIDLFRTFGQINKL